MGKIKEYFINNIEANKPIEYPPTFHEDFMDYLYSPSTGKKKNKGKKTVANKPIRPYNIKTNNNHLKGGFE